MNIQAKLMEKFLKKFDGTSFCVMFETGEEIHIGTLPPKFKVLVHEPVAYKKLLQSTSLALGEAYMDGDLEIEGDIVEALDEIFKFQNQFKTNRRALKKLLYTSTSKNNQKKEVCSHYNLGNDFYKLWLDPTLSYSCAYFENGDETLEEAQYKKIDHILKKLCLKEGMSLLDIGCGWGFLLIQAAKKYKIHGVGITLSEEQHHAFSKRIKEEGLEEYLKVELMDYRELITSGMQFDRVVSVGMLEHVGRDNYELFFKNVDAVLKEKGIFLLHYISGYGEYPGDAWIKKYIFPGGVIPSLREIISLSADFKYYVQDVESLRRHYVKTLLCWHKAFEEHLPEIGQMFEERFIRMWRMYLCACAASFNNGVIDLHQIQFVKGVNNELPMTRKYQYEK
ncbi:MAG: cyclopropane-fatty-acyl-phospholipid synthase family protein [Candidatus Cellulosilyticum pullistercoris]|uniref:Cyclopropane-fatty-acyl-phospholipid synthase family protein n=1 Tax=Candidatus Cellulosilyticum pullistercoris TaxID=2838521 RepID=A0A9E2KBJ9_9FIRM|nr:cyclopropane-fatty-acyl-phospholipid synthase family protein [Candidatus Cellulosilyticum pullistercoris]